MAATAIRPLRIDDAPHVARIFFHAVHEGTRNHYSPEQRLAWGGGEMDPEYWRHRLAELIGFVAQQDGQPVGFMTIDASGYIDLAFVSPSAAGTGVGWQLYQVVEEKARQLGASVLTTEASKAAKPFFERQGWTIVAEQTVKRQNVGLTNYTMRKDL